MLLSLIGAFNGGGGTCVHTNGIKQGGLGLAAPPGPLLHQHFGFIIDLHDLPQNLLPLNLQEGGDLPQKLLEVLPATRCHQQTWFCITDDLLNVPV